MSPALAIAAARFWRERPREAVLAGAVTLAALVALAGSAWSTPTLSGLPGAGRAEAPPAPPPLLVRQLAPEDALAINQAIPIAEGPNPAAKPFSLGKADATARARALECLASAVYYEAGNESADGQRAVAQVVLNRVRHPAFPASVCGVVYEGSTRATGCQFTFTCDGSLARRPVPALWQRARSIAEAALAGYVFKPVGNSTHYHANYVVPYWAPTLAKSNVVGTHIFYRWAGGWGRPGAFSQRYSRAEPSVEALRLAAVQAEAAQAAAALAEGEPLKVDEEKDFAAVNALLATPSPIEGGKRVAIRFNLAARKAVEEAPREPYVEKVAASDNLRWSLGGAEPEADQKPLGRAGPTVTAAGSAGAGSPE